MASSKRVGRPKAVEPDNTAANPSDTDDSLSGEVREPSLGPARQSGDLGTLGPYRVLKKIGVGGMGIVYLGFDDSLNRKVALKVMLPKVAVNAAARERFLREARASASVEHPNVVGIYLVGEHAKVPFLAMQYLQGAPLDKYLAKKGPPSITQILRVAKETTDGLAAAHAKGLVHRDIKPANLWLEAPHGHIKILDFGLAKPNGEDGGSELTQTGAVVGTPAYMAPEQARALPVDARTDLYSLGAVLYRLATGKQPFSGPNVMAVLTALATDTPTPVCELNPAIPPALAELIHKLLEKDPNRRPKNAAEVVAALKSIEKGLTGSGMQPLAPANPAEPAPYLPPLFVIPDGGMSGSNAPSAESHFENLDETIVPSATAPHVTEARTSNAKLKPADAATKKLPVWMYIAAGVAVVALLVGAGAALLSGSKPAVATDDQPKRASDRSPDRVAPVKSTTEKPAVPKPSAKGTPLKEKWLKDFAATTPDVQKAMLERELMDRHPIYDGVLKFTEANGTITGVDLVSTTISDLIPFSAVKTLTSFSYRTPHPNGDALSDLKPLAELPIAAINLYGHKLLTDFTPLKAMPLKSLKMQHVPISDLSPLAGKTMTLLMITHCGLASLEGLAGTKIDEVQIYANSVSDLTPLAGSEVKTLCFNAERVNNIAALKNCPLEKLSWEPSTHRISLYMLQPIRTCTTLTTIQTLPAAEYWTVHDLRFARRVIPMRQIMAHEGSAVVVRYSPDGALFASGGADNFIRIHTVANYERAASYKAPGTVSAISFVPGTELLIIKSGDKLHFHKAKTGEPDGTPIEAPFSIGGYTVSADGKRVMAGPSTSPSTDVRLWQWSLPDRKPLDPLAAFGGTIGRCGYTRDGRYAAAAGFQKRTWVWDLQEGVAIYKHTGTGSGLANGAIFTPDGKTLILSDDQGNLSRVEWQSSLEKPLPRLLHTQSMLLHTDGRHLIVGARDGWISVIDIEAGKLVGQADGMSNVRSMSSSPDGATLITAHLDGNLRVWDFRELIKP